MSESAAQVREILRHLEAEGDLSRASFRGECEWTWDRVTPGLLALLAIHTAVVDELGGLPDDGGVERLLAEAVAHTRGLERFDVGDLAALLRADVVRSSRPDGPDGLTWGGCFRLLGGLVAVRRMSSADLDDLLERAEAACRHMLGTGLLTEPRVRDGEYGPWDVSESWSPETERIAVASLRVPRIPGVDILPYRTADGILGATAKLVGVRFLLQAFEAGSTGKTWDSSRRGIIANVMAKGGEAEEATHALGPEVMARMPRPTDGEITELKFVGCDGPGWILRGMMSGIGAMAAVIDLRIHFLFTHTVVDLRARDGAGG
ncbi:DUF3710 domain-containing protein [Streptomyces sp. CMB-StM0423]|uniref:DUF3710 domain-containing protein n=1 Tax=Streptomyces sp. CMB-StM0423 TaxID=2059884 RepID=UPI000C6FD4F5|nr:DUF3710 domain-containing protein [Streptomyces sp. CMB-StM0423]AUH43222.1 hypothetical protein CXR04_26385 [Streptomyces sp. CMB-StM0423]